MRQGNRYADWFSYETVSVALQQHTIARKDIDIAAMTIEFRGLIKLPKD